MQRKQFVLSLPNTMAGKIVKDILQEWDERRYEGTSGEKPF
tara:strand:- start:358 stop:480 length:123 start_codon:yes stop_codon:yes gene_type:complete